MATTAAGSRDVGADASGAARAAAAVATLEMETNARHHHQREPRGTNDAGDDFDVDALVAAARAKTSANRAEASRSEVRASPDRHEPTTLIVAVDSAVQTEDASLTEDASPTEDASLTPSRARRSLEFETETVAIAEAIAEANA